MSKIVVRLWGGMGNQMFQYAFGRQIAELTGVNVKFDIDSGFPNDVYRRQFALGEYKTKTTCAEAHEIPLGMSWDSPWHRIAKFGWSAIPSRLRRVVYEKAPFQFDPSVVTAKQTPSYYFGYWQHEGYFKSIQDTLNSEFTLKSEFTAPAKALILEMAQCRAVSLHVRRYHDIGADGRIIARARGHHGVCGPEYFEKALTAIGIESGTVCYVFSDHLPWVKANLQLPVPCRYIADLGPFSDAEELLLMASCQHHVISNSSFSWWGAWLGKNRNKVIVAPKIWLRGLSVSPVNICPENWVRI